MRRKEVVNMTSVIGTKFSLSSFYGKEEKNQMMYKMRLNVLNKSQGMKKAAGTAIRKGRVKMSTKYDELKTLDSFYATPSPVKPKKVKVQKKKLRQSSNKSLEARNPRPSRQASAAASEKMASFAAQLDDDIDDVLPDRPNSIKLKKRTFKEAQECWSSDDDDDNNWIPRTSKGTVAKKRTVPEPPPPEPVLSEYEKSAQEKIAQRQKFLEELGILQMKRELQKIPKSIPTPPQKKEHRQSACNDIGMTQDEAALPTAQIKEPVRDESDTAQSSSDQKLEDSLAPDSPLATEERKALEVERCPPSIESQDSNSGTQDSASKHPVAPSIHKPSKRRSPMKAKQVKASNSVPKVLKTLRATAAKATEQAKATKGLPRTLKQNLDELVKPGSHPRRILNTLADTKRKIRRKLT
ncbi:breast carcinoma-amplified sequence 1 homolog [Penaeus chinensis]|uniref:breast carcinoma-amplified sequence 1 homolog n=1 Tax=Penaeus chinensis TaxID=139456 RepID=UPI001FB6E2BA|nr:breast carcinoma-amplified sequence 1 homolog [Penaeus chinensis]